MSTTKFDEGKWVLLFCLFLHRLPPSLILRHPRSFAVPFAREREVKGTANDLGCLRIRLTALKKYKSSAKTFSTSVGCEAAPLEVVMIITMSFILGVQKHVAE